MIRPRRAFLFFALLALAAPLASQTATLVRDINPLPDSTGSASLPRDLHAVGAKVFFSAVEATSGRELWVTDGTASGTELLADACPGDCSSNPSLLGAVGSTLFWTTFSANGVQLWRSDGTRAGTFPLTGEGIGLNRFLNELVYAFSDRLFFFVGCIAPASCQLWASDGTTAGTRPVKGLTLGPGGSVLELLAIGGRVYVIRRGSSGPALWATDGTAAGTVLVRDFGTGQLNDLTAAEGKELWASDGTTAGTLQLTHFPAPAPFAEPSEVPALKASGRRVYFVADDSVHGRELWASDGTVAGTKRLTDFAYATPFDTTSDLSCPRPGAVDDRRHGGRHAHAARRLPRPL